MSRFMALALCFVLPTAAHAASLKDFELSKMLEKVAKESSVGTPRAINEDILDQGYTVEGNQLINHLSVRASHAERMRSNPDSVRSQLGDSVCSNTGYRQLLARGAILTYSFTGTRPTSRSPPNASMPAAAASGQEVSAPRGRHAGQAASAEDRQDADAVRRSTRDGCWSTCRRVPAVVLQERLPAW